MTRAVPFYSIGKDHHGVRHVEDEHGIVASVEIETRGRSKPVWRIEADPDRFPLGAVLPDVFGGKPVHELDLLPDVYRMFGVAVPGTVLVETSQAVRSSAPASDADETRGEAA